MKRWYVSYINIKGYGIIHGFDKEQESRHFGSIVEGTNIKIYTL